MTRTTKGDTVAQHGINMHFQNIAANSPLDSHANCQTKVESSTNTVDQELIFLLFFT